MIFAESGSALILGWLEVRDALLCQAVQHSEIDLPQAVVFDQIQRVRKLGDDEAGGLGCSRKRRDIDLLKAE